MSLREWPLEIGRDRGRWVGASNGCKQHGHVQATTSELHVLLLLILPEVVWLPVLYCYRFDVVLSL